eukprot:359062-Chlamydomonas_euryale.AAC.5
MLVVYVCVWGGKWLLWWWWPDGGGCDQAAHAWKVWKRAVAHATAVACAALASRSGCSVGPHTHTGTQALQSACRGGGHRIEWGATAHTTEEAVKTVREGGYKEVQASKQASKKARKQASERASERWQASKQASKRASKQVSKQASERASERWQASKQASKQASEQASVGKQEQLTGMHRFPHTALVGKRS